jgi:biopolymer transport protein TolR
MGMNVGGNSGGVKNDINVTPLIDVLLVLLIIFLVIIPIMMKMETINVPRDIQTDEMPDPDASQLTIKVHADLSMTFNDGTTEVPITASEVEGRLRPKLENLHLGKEKVVFVDFEDGVPWKLVVGTMDSIRKLASDASHDEIKVALKVKLAGEAGAPKPSP